MNDAQGSAPEVSEVVRAAQATEMRLSADPSFAPNVIAILTKRLQAPISTETLGLIVRGLSEYADPEVATFMVQALVFEDLDDAFLEDDRSQFSASVEEWLKLLRAMFGDSVYRANLKSQQRPDDWMFFTREVLQDPIRKGWLVRITIEKYNGGEFNLEGGANMPLNLIRELFILLQAFPNRGAFGTAELEQMSNEIAAFEAKFGPITGDASLATGPAYANPPDLAVAPDATAAPADAPVPELVAGAPAPH
jgi:hypothetical protein